jgi:hypothetical protein
LKRYFGSFVFICFFAAVLAAQDDASRHSLEVGGGGVFPLSGWKASEYSVGPALHVGYQLRLQKYVAVEAGWTGSWGPTNVGFCSPKYGCEYLGGEVGFLDYGLRGIVPVAAGRVELSVGLGGGYDWYGNGYNYFNSALIQYSGRATVAIDRRKHFRVGFTIRTWRDLGRPTQQWLSTTVSLVYGLGKVR